MASPSLTQSQLKDLLHYDPDTGIFTNKVFRGPKALKNAEVGCINSKGYLTLNIKLKNYKCHRLAWLYIYGVWPKDQIDHINQNKIDNRIANLRDVTKSQNGQNTSLRADNTSGHKGVSWSKGHRKWQAQIKVNNVYLYLGYFDNLDGAVAARKQAEEQLHTHRIVA